MHAIADLSVTIPPELVDEFLAKLPYVSESVGDFELLTPERNCVRFQLTPGHELDEKVIAGRISEVAQKMCQSHRPGTAKVLAASNGDITYRLDPHPLLEAQGELFRYGSGRYGLGPKSLWLLEFFDRRLTRLARQFSAAPHQYPNMIGADTLDRCKYFQTFPHSLSLITHLREDLEALKDFAKNAKWDGNRLTHARENLSDVQCLLAPAVCFHCYAWLHDSQLDEPRVITAVGKCFRYESTNLTALERLWDFTMREIIFLGPRDYVLSQRKKAIDEAVTILDEWGLAYDIRSATDPFFIEEYSAQVAFQSGFDLKYEIQAALPYKDKTFAVGSFNHHQDFFGRSFDIKTASGEPVHTGCAAFGLERLVLAFFAQHGLDPENWPEAVAREARDW